MQQNENSSTKILKKMIVFSVPLILSGLLQQLFNWVDALIVGSIGVQGVQTRLKRNVRFESK